MASRPTTAHTLTASPTPFSACSPLSSNRTPGGLDPLAGGGEDSHQSITDKVALQRAPPWCAWLPERDVCMT